MYTCLFLHSYMYAVSMARNLDVQVENKQVVQFKIPEWCSFSVRDIHIAYINQTTFIMYIRYIMIYLTCLYVGPTCTCTYMYIHVYTCIYMYIHVYMYTILIFKEGSCPSKIQSPLIVPYSDFFLPFSCGNQFYHFECFVTLVTHSQGHRGQMSQIHMYMKVISVFLDTKFH